VMRATGRPKATGRPRKRFGQHFLEEAWVAKVVDVIAPDPADCFLEVGPGRGALTLALAESKARVVAVEIDRDLVRVLRRLLPKRVTLVAADVLQVDLDELPLGDQPARAVGNLPFNIGSAVLRRLVEFADEGERLRDATLMFQREVADRVTARPGTSDWGPLAVMTQLYTEPKQLLTLPPGAFRPMPKVRSAVVQMVFGPARVTVSDKPFFGALVRQMFTQRRKTGLNALRPFVDALAAGPTEAVFEQAQVDPQQRPGDLELSELADLSEVLANRRG
jgi:16S rRNA (adenine1518-N6/adenine1519-N6)-dimethyltransferase